MTIKMNLINSYFRGNKYQFIIFLLLLWLFLFSTLILPTHEKISYYQDKNKLLIKEQNILKKYFLHLKNGKDRYSDLEKKLKEINQQAKGISHDQQINRVLNRISRNYQLEIISQQTKNLNSIKDFKQVLLKQTLEGKYNQIVKYLEEILSLSSALIVLTDCEIINSSIISKNPIIKVTLTFRSLSLAK